ncbi:dTDP-4-dehydrorhamnose reductase [uncultured Roseovarius sp.]|uniref:dTDP-4-dehydrorhamnose reductase n=1 Tax=uncultured Roseovarius sp. TaxID=293344 RepID=UPI00262CEC34|nr:dTDP-4-dehydrorhamnose reductase [uncultured Roseovarius sp.]
MTILVFGKNGQVATELAMQADVVCVGRDQADLTNPDACAAKIAELRPAAVINAAAYTAVDKAESEEDMANVINGDAPGAMAKACARLDIPLVHISTDYVFEGGGTDPWQPADANGPLSAYGRSKLKGEEAIRAANGPHAILRTSWVVSAHGANFVKTMLRLGADRDRLTIVADQIGGPTPARDIARTCHQMAKDLIADPSKTGTHHFSGAPDVSWADFAREIFAQSGITCEVADIPTSDYPTPAARPLNSRMDCSALETAFGISRPDWRSGLTDILSDLKAAQT